MNMFNYAVRLRNNGTWASCRDIPEFNTEGDDVEDTLSNARGGLISALSLYQNQGRAFPQATFAEQGERVVYLPVAMQAKGLLWNEMVDKGISRSDLSRLLNTNRTLAGRIVDMNFNSKLEQIEKALFALNLRMVVSVV